MKVKALVVGPLQVNCYLVACEETRQAAVIDPGSDGERILSTLETMGVKLRLVVNTHGHFDHIGGNRLLVERTGAELALHADDVPLLGRARDHAAHYGLAAETSPPPDRVVRHGDHLTVGTVDLEVLHVPGHSPGGICLHGGEVVFTGDALFAGSIGRTDLPGGDQGLLLAGIRRHLLTLPPDTVVLPGHGPASTIGREQEENPFVGRKAGA